jgi:hypothetical protein
MAGKPGMHKKLLNPAAMQTIREKIQTEKLINSLQNHVYGLEEMRPSQVTAALGLLKKSVPDLSSVEHSGDADNPVEIINRIEIVALDDDSTD